MLKAIELSGFKSFADRTRLEFEGGISALVGPNGSGKSNVVDAVKWVLGEQSMKKLRGNESTDVIFNGAAGRPPLGSAEVTLTFDNSTGIFALDTPEVHITRRVYRSGEGEYLINRQASRLKDIKDLLSGTGLGTQAYSIIEQGRVESLLNSSSIQRRVIFEESAGISRFNARKQEVGRRLERVEQNLVRLSDIVSEVDHQLKTARSQAGKAQLYRQYTTRLQELRIHAGLIDYRKRTEKYQEIQKELGRLNTLVENLSKNVDETEITLIDFNLNIEQIDQEIRRLEGNAATNKERISGEESSIQLQAAQIEELEMEIVHNGRQLIEMNVRSVDIEEMMQKTTDDIQKATQNKIEVTDSYEQLLRRGEELAGICKTKQDEKNSLRKEAENKSRQNAKLAGSVSGLESRLLMLQQTKEQNAVRLERIRLQNEELVKQCSEFQASVIELEDSVAKKLEQLERAKQRKSSRAKELVRLSRRLSELKQRQSGMRERISVLEELIRKNEGLSPGVKEVLQQAKDPKSPFRHVFGLVADLLRVDVKVASLIELALGANAQYVVVSPKAELFRHIERNAAQFAGRVGFIWLDPREKETPWTKTKGFLGRPGVLGRADQFVKSDSAFQHLANRLLGRTWIVENISVARNLYKESDDRTNFLTLSGELLTPDGALIVGPPNSSSGLITRRSELRTLAEQMLLLDSEVSEAEVADAVAREEVANDEIDVESETREHQKAVTQFDSQRQKLLAAEERQGHAAEQIQHLDEEIEKLDKQILRISDEMRQTKMIREQIDEELARLELRQIEVRQEHDNAESNHVEHQRKTTNAKIELAKSEERLDFLNERARQFEERLKERQNLLTEHRRRSRSHKERRESLLLAILQIESLLASLYLKKESLANLIMQTHDNRRKLATKRNTVQNDLKQVQQELQKNQTKVHTKQLELEHCLQEQKTLLDRIREEYGIDLTEFDRQNFSSTQNEIDADEKTGDGDETTANENQLLENEPEEKTTLSFDPEVDYQKEIDDIKSKLQRLGSVNLEAIETLEDLETRHMTLSNQYNDLISAKRNIEKIIEKINVDSQRLFEETFEGVKLHFRDLFQHLFGGGSADLVLEDPENVLESGVDIVAKPPGKELKNVTLLSGGEKTMTCVALLLAFFRHRPNPVCILDECDAALDEGNIDRFVRVIKEFGTQTQFLMITHSKKTMAAASTIYGVTMQESGVSKPISVRFSQVGENGEILDYNEVNRAA